MPQRIVSELQALASETRRKHPEVRQAADAALRELQRDPDAALAASRAQADAAPEGGVLLQPVLLACATKTPKVVLLAVALLHRCVLLHAVPDSALPRVVEALQSLTASPSRTDIDAQLRILQTVSALITGYTGITAQLLSSTLMVCFALYEHSRVAVVSSTAAATLRQSIMVVFDKVNDEDHALESIQGGGEAAALTAPLPVHTAKTPDGHVTLFPCAADAYLLFSDLCALANGEAASFLPLTHLARPFALELLESVLTNHARLFATATHESDAASTHPELRYVLRSGACPLLLKLLSDPPPFAVYVRAMRLVLLLLRQFNEELVLEIEILLRMVLKALRQPERGTPYWQRVLAMEVVRWLCADSGFMRRLWRTGSPAAADGAPPMFAELLETLRVVTRECDAALAPEPALAAARAALPALHEHAPDAASATRRASGTFYGAAAGVASAAVAGVRSAAEGFLSGRAEPLTAASAPGVPLIDQLDKAEAPAGAALPPEYLALLALWSHVLLAQSLAHAVLRKYVATVARRGSPHAPRALDEEEPEAPTVRSAVGMLRACATPLNEGLARFLTAQSSEYLYDQALLALANLAESAGAAGAAEERDAFLGTLAGLAEGEPGAGVPPARQSAALLALAQVTTYLAGVLEMRWPMLLACICRAVARLAPHGGAAGAAGAEPEAALPPPSLPVPPGAPADELRDPTLHLLAPAALAPAALTRTLLGVFDRSVWMDDTAFIAFAAALGDLAAQERTTGVPLAQVERAAQRNMRRLAAQLPGGAWDALLTGVWCVVRDADAPPARRTQAAAVYDTLLLHALRTVLHEHGETDAAKAQQRHVLQRLAQQAAAGDADTSGSLEIRRAALESLLRVVESDGHRVRDGWDVVLHVCSEAGAAPGEARHGEPASPPLAKPAFTCLQRICAEHLGALTAQELEQCIACLAQFGTQPGDVNAALGANAAFWNVAAEIQQRQHTLGAGAGAELWLCLLRRMLPVTAVPDRSVRDGAVSNLFQVLLQYSASLDAGTWRRVYEEIVFALLDTLEARAGGGGSGTADGTGDAGAGGGASASPADVTHSRVLAFQGTAQLLRETAQALAKQGEFRSVWDAFLARVASARAAAEPQVALAAVDALLDALDAGSSAGGADADTAAWRCAVRLAEPEARAGAAPLPLLLRLVTLHERLYARLPHAALGDTEALLRTLHTCVAQGLASADGGAATALETLVERAQGTALHVREAPQGAGVAPLVLASAAERVRLALGALRAARGSAPRRAHIARRTLAHWHEVYVARSAERAVYEEAVPASLAVLADVLHVPAGGAAGAASDTATDAALWYLAGEALCRVAELGSASDAAPRHARFWSALFAAFVAALHAAPSRPPREEDEAAKRRMLQVLRERVLPAAGEQAAAHEALGAFVSPLLDATVLYKLPGVQSAADEAALRAGGTGTRLPVHTVAHERVAYWTWELLFAVCADARAGVRRVALACLPPMLHRVQHVLHAYAADAAIRGAAPMPRVRVEEVLFLQQQLLRLRLWDGALLEAEALRGGAAPRGALLRCEVAHLFYLGGALDALAALRSGVQRGAIGTSLAPLDGERERRDAARRAAPEELAQETLAVRAAFLCQGG